MEESLIGRDRLPPKLQKEKEIEVEEKHVYSQQEPPVKRLFSHLGWRWEVPTLAMFTPTDDGDWFPGNLPSEVYEILVGGPRLKCLDGLGFGLGWALRGRVFYPKGVLPTSLFSGDKSMEYESSLFLKELFFSLRQLGEGTDRECVYQVKFTPVPLWPEDWQHHRPKLPRRKEFSKLHSDIRTICLPIESHAKHARGLGLPLNQLDRIDGLMSVREFPESNITIWRTPQFSSPDFSNLRTAANTPIEADCIEVLFDKIFEKAKTIPVDHNHIETCAEGYPVMKTEEKYASLSVSVEEEYVPPQEEYVSPSVSVEECGSLSVSSEECGSSSVSFEEYGSPSLSVEEYGSPSVSVEEYGLLSVSCEEYESLSLSVEEYGSLSVSSEECGSSSVTVEEKYVPPQEEYVSPSVSVEECGSLSVSSEECGSPSVSVEECGSPSVSVEEYGLPSVSCEDYGSPSVSCEDYGSPSVSLEEFSSSSISVLDEPKRSESTVAILPKTRSFKKRLGSFIRRLFGCASRPSRRH